MAQATESEVTSTLAKLSPYFKAVTKTADIASKAAAVIKAAPEDRLKTGIVKTAEMAGGYLGSLAGAATEEAILASLMTTAGAEVVAGSAAAAVATGGASLVAQVGIFAAATVTSYAVNAATTYAAKRLVGF